MLDLNLNPSRRHLRQFGYIAGGVFLLLAALSYWRGELVGIELGGASPIVAAACAGVAALSLSFSVMAPGVNRFLYIALTVVTYPLGWLLSHAILALLFYGVLTPIGLLFRILGRDPLRRMFEPELETYWEPHEKATDTRRYFRQF